GSIPVPRPRFGIKSRLAGAFAVIGLLLVAVHPLRRDQREVRPNPTLELPLLESMSSGPVPSVVLPTAYVPQGGSPAVWSNREPTPLASQTVPSVRRQRASPSASGAQAPTSSPTARTGNETQPSASTTHSGVEPGSPLDPVLQYGRF
ncbi:MAG TPA: hypothetical protein VKP30_19855, partial [Polyangiaceae bacterium]|nr:hypothetical protein [Polyangiaceae bacterium]